MLTNFKSQILNQPFNLLLVTAVLLFVFSFLTLGQSMDIHLHDTYFVFSTILFIWVVGTIFLLIWAIYQLTRKFLWQRFLTWFHVVVTIFILVLLVTVSFWHDKLIPPVKRDFVSFYTFEQDRQREARIILPLGLLFLVSQLAFVLNIVGGFINKFVRAN
jgi:hypothetical protein